MFDWDLNMPMYGYLENKHVGLVFWTSKRRQNVFCQS